MEIQRKKLKCLNKDRASFCVCLCVNLSIFQIVLLKLMLSNNIYISQCFHIKTDGKVTCPQGTSFFPLIANAAVKAANIFCLKH